MNKSKKIIITTGDPNGIGAEITRKALKHFDREEFTIVSNKNILGISPDVEVDFEGEVRHSVLTKEAGEFSYQCLKKACELAKTGEYKAIVTAPVAKEALHLAGHNFSGQTEILEHFLAHDGQKAEMLFIAKDFRVLLLTRHVALKEINLTKEMIIDKIWRLNDFFRLKMAQINPKIALCALNPHAGENGLFGSEEKEILIPAVEELKQKGVDITMPKPADTLFIEAAENYLKGIKPPFDCYIACYHDQGLIPIKTVASANTVNMTIGLDIIRTSPCHGTAFDIAGKDIANEHSMIQAIIQAQNTK